MAICQAWGSINSNYRIDMVVTPDYANRNVAENYTPVDYSVILYSGGGYSFNTIGSTIIVNVDGEVFNSYSQKSISANGSLVLASGRKNVYHGADGKKTLNFSFSYDQTATASYTPGDMYSSGSIALTDIPRYTNITAFSLASKTVNSITYNYTVDSAIDWKQYQLNGGAWIDDGGTNTISGLLPNTTYTIKIKVKNAASQLWTESSSIIVTTDNVAAIASSTSAITIGEPVNVKSTNPGSCNLHLVITYNNIEIIARTTDITADYNIVFTQLEKELLYRLCATSNTSTFKIILKSYFNSVKIGESIKDLQVNWPKTARVNVGGIDRDAIFWCRPTEADTWKQAIVFGKPTQADPVWHECI